MTHTFCILNFHGIGIPHKSVDQGEAPYWVSVDRFHRILDQIETHRERGHQIKITFDDGNRSDMEIAVPELRKRGLIGHFFVLTGRCEDPRYLSAAEIRALADSEMLVGLHGRDHVDWRRIDDPTLEAETVTARATLSDMAGMPIDTVGIPFGGYDRRVMRQLKRTGFSEIYRSDGGLASDRTRLRHRTSIRAGMSDSFIESVLAGRESPMRRMKRALKTILKEHVV